MTPAERQMLDVLRQLSDTEQELAAANREIDRLTVAVERAEADASELAAFTFPPSHPVAGGTTRKETNL